MVNVSLPPLAVMEHKTALMAVMRQDVVSYHFFVNVLYHCRLYSCLCVSNYLTSTTEEYRHLSKDLILIVTVSQSHRKVATMGISIPLIPMPENPLETCWPSYIDFSLVNVGQMKIFISTFLGHKELCRQLLNDISYMHF